MKNLPGVILLSCISLATFGQQATTRDTATLDFKEAIKIGIDNNVLLNQQKNNLYSRQVQRNQSRAALAPTVYAQGSLTRNEGQQANPENGNFEDLTVDNVNGAVTAELTLFNGFSRINTLQQNNRLLRAQEFTVGRSQQDAIYNITTQYLQVLLDQELLRIASENYKTQRVLLDQLREQVSLGSRAESDLYTQDAQVRNMELLALRAKATLENDNAILAQTLQLDPAIPFKVSFPQFSEDLAALKGASLDSLYTIASSSRKDLKQQEYLMKAGQSTYKASANGYYPRVTLFASYGTQYYSIFPSNFKDQFWDNNLNLTYGVNLYIPIFDRLLTRSTRVANKVLYDNARLQYENLEKTVKIDVRRAYNNYVTSIQAYHASQVQYQAGELALKTQQESFVLGVSDQVALALANQTYVQAASSRAQAEVTLVFQRILMGYALGTLTEVDLE